MPRLQGLIFDLDGTLLDSAPDLRQAVNLTLRAYGRHEIGIDEIKNLVGDGMMTLVQRAFAATGKPLDTIGAQKAAQLFLANYQGLPPDRAQIYPYVLEQLDRFQKSGVRLGLCTNKQEAATHSLLEDLEMARYFAFVAGYDTFPTHKPHAGHVLGVMNRLEVDVGECAMVGDSANDIAAAHGAGIPCIGITHGYDNNIGNMGADHLMQDFRDLPSTLITLGFEFR
jgi:phosphoglycolate phosphatase